jgi:chemotaxis protein histidine kinase CheA
MPKYKSIKKKNRYKTLKQAYKNTYKNKYRGGMPPFMRFFNPGSRSSSQAQARAEALQAQARAEALQAQAAAEALQAQARAEASQRAEAEASRRAEASQRVEASRRAEASLRARARGLHPLSPYVLELQDIQVLLKLNREIINEINLIPAIEKSLVQNNQHTAHIYINDIYDRAYIILNRMMMPDINTNPLIEHALSDLLAALANTTHHITSTVRRA